MKYIFLILISFMIKNISAVELSCLFEEVHQTGDTHQGAIIVKDQNFQINQGLLKNNFIKLSIGKKRHLKIEIN